MRKLFHSLTCILSTRGYTDVRVKAIAKQTQPKYIVGLVPLNSRNTVVSMFTVE